MKKSFCLLFLILFISSSAVAQRCFKAYDRLGREVTTFCVGERITFRDCGGVDADKEYYDYDKSNGVDFNAPEATQKYFTYTKTGEVTVTQLGNLNGITDTYEQKFKVVDTPLPTFTTTACANRTVLINITDTQYDYYSVRFGDGASIVVTKDQTGNPIKHTYATAGPHEISIIGRYTGSFCTSAPALTKAPELPAYTSPVISTLKVQKQDAATGSVDFSFSNLISGYTYTLQRKSETDTDFTTAANITVNQTSYTLANTNTATRTEYRLIATDACGTVLPTSNKAATIIHTTTGGNEQVTINWQTITNFFKQFDIYRNGVLLKSVSGNTVTYTDSDVSCGQNNCYEIKGITTDGKATSVTAQNCILVTSTATPPAPALHTTFNLQNEVELTLQLPNGQSIKSATYQRSINGAPYSDWTTTTQLSITDKPKTLSPVCYRATFTNPCDKTSAASAPSCPVILTAKLTPDETVQLIWSGYVGFPDGVKGYVLEVLDESGSVLRSINVQGNTHTEQLANQQEQLIRYRIRATSASGAVTYSNTETIKLELALFVPSGFTPNGDGLNDVFEVKGKRFENFRIRIMNSAGQVVYTADDRAASWGGTYNGKLQPAGVYAYEITVTLQDGSTKRRTGTVTLLR